MGVSCNAATIAMWKLRQARACARRVAVRSALRRFGAQGPKSPSAAPSRSGSTGRQAACRQADGFRVFEVGIDADNDDASFDGEQFDTDQRDARPGVDDDSLVENP